MARVQCSDLVVDGKGVPLSNILVTVTPRAGTGSSSLWASETGGITLTSVVTNAKGIFSVWLDEGRYDVTPAGSDTRTVELLREDIAVVNEQPNLIALGADSTGVVDATSILTTAVGSGHRKVIAPPGKYLANFSATNVKGLTLEGAGDGTVFHNTTGSADALKFVACDELTVRDIRVQGTSGTRDGLHLENCQRAKVERVFSLGTGRACMWAQRCFGIVFDDCIASRDSVGPYPTGVGLQQAGLVLTWDNSDVTSGCNQAVINGGVYVIGQTPQSSTSTAQFTPGWAIQAIRCEDAQINGPITELGAGGIYAQFCSGLAYNGYYCELNPSDIEYSTGTMSVTTGTTAVVGVGTTWKNAPASPEVDNGYPGKYLVAPIGAGMSYAKVAALTDNTNITLAAQTEVLQTGWPGATQAGAAYRLTSFDVFLDNSKNCEIHTGRGGGAIALKASSWNKIWALTESVLIDGTSGDNEVNVTTNRASASAARVVDQGVRTILGRQINYQDGSQVQPSANFPTYTTATKPSAATVKAGTVIFVSDGGAGAVFQGSTGAAWVNLG